ncbi:hypothetical protein ACIQW5_10450 [Methylorubrum thiocyanatum]|uniref:hypothetical protein n=1 Tax=Methylorubrum thiocyanatum TaxID=47958 RepID=UPI00383BAC2B
MSKVAAEWYEIRADELIIFVTQEKSTTEKIHRFKDRTFLDKVSIEQAGTVRGWCEEQQIAVWECSDVANAFRIVPQTDAEAFLVKMRWY